MSKYFRQSIGVTTVIFFIFVSVVSARKQYSVPAYSESVSYIVIAESEKPAMDDIYGPA